MRQAERRNFHYIYKITRDDGKYYIGMHSTDDLDDGYFGSGRILWYSIKKHGKDVHKKQVVEFLPSRTLLKEREAVIVNKELLLDPGCMNLAVGGGANATNEQRLKWGLEAQRKPVLTEEDRAKIRLERSLRRHSEETKLKMSEYGKGKSKSPEHIAKIAEARLSNMTDETRMKLGSGNRGKAMLAEQKIKISESGKDSWTNERREAASQRSKRSWTDERKAATSKRVKEFHEARRHKCS